ncbi:MAG: hypothetical protein KGM91_10845 [Burkholderiales bacterium]|nr:hypothetical protein [Burkholderiales bacterium]
MRTPLRPLQRRAAGPTPRLLAAATVVAFAAWQQAATAAPPPWAAMPASLLPLRLPVAESPGWTLGAEASDFEASDATPARALSGDWKRYSPRRGRNVALQSARLQLGAARAGWEFAAVLRSDVLISGTRSAFDLVHDFKQHLAPAEGSRFDLGTEARGAVWAGLRVAHSWALWSSAQEQPRLLLTGAATLLSARRAEKIDTAGSASWSAAAGYTLQASGLRLQSFRSFSGFGNAGATGAGYSVDVGLLWRPGAGSFVNLSAVDLLSSLRIGNVATQRLGANSSTRSQNPDGSIDYQPLLSGRYSAETLSLKLAPKWSAIAGWAFAGERGPWRLGARWERVDGLDLPALWAELPLGKGWQGQLDAETRFRVLGVGLRWRGAALMLRSRSLGWGRSNAIGWQAGLSLPL